MTIDQILKQNFGLTGKAESFTNKPKKIKRYNPELMMNSYSYIMNDKYKQIAEAALLRADVMTMKARGEDDNSILKKVSNAGKDLWRLVKKLVVKIMIFIQETALKLTSKVRKAEKLAAKVEDYRDEYYLQIRKNKNYKETEISVKVMSGGNFGKTYKLSEEILNSITNRFNTGNAIRSTSNTSAKNFVKIIKNIINDPVDYEQSLKLNIETTDKNINSYNKTLKLYTGANYKKPEMTTITKRGDLGNYLRSMEDKLKDTIKAVKITTKDFIVNKKTLNLLKTAPTKVTDKFTPELLQNIRISVTKETELMNIKRKICNLVLNEAITQTAKTLSTIKDVIYDGGKDFKSYKKDEDKKEETKKDDNEVKSKSAEEIIENKNTDTSKQPESSIDSKSTKKLDVLSELQRIYDNHKDDLVDKTLPRIDMFGFTYTDISKYNIEPLYSFMYSEEERMKNKSKSIDDRAKSELNRAINYLSSYKGATSVLKMNQAIGHHDAVVRSLTPKPDIIMDAPLTKNPITISSIHDLKSIFLNTLKELTELPDMIKVTSDDLNTSRKKLALFNRLSKDVIDKIKETDPERLTKYEECLKGEVEEYAVKKRFYEVVLNKYKQYAAELLKEVTNIIK